MKVYEAASIRNVAVVGHGGCGKTQLVSGLLFAAGATTRLGRVDEGNAPTDFDDEAIARRHTLSTGLAHLEWQHTKVNLLDTPGFANFYADARSALKVADGVVVVVDGVAGTEVQTEKLWADASAAGLPRIVVVNRLDRDRASVNRALDSLRRHCATSIVPVQLPVGEAHGFSGVIDLVRMVAFTPAPDGSGRASEGPVSENMHAEAQAAREQLMEVVAEADESLLDAYFANGSLTTEELSRGLTTATLSGRVFPLFCAAGLQMIGVAPLLDALVELLPSPASRPFQGLAPGGEPVALDAGDHAPYSAFVWKTIADPFAGRITMLRVLTGSLSSDTTVHNGTRDHAERLGHLLVLQGKVQTHVPALNAGDLGAVAKLKDTHTNDILCERATSVRVAPIAFPEAVLSYAIEPKSRGDEDKISASMHRLQEEDPSVGFSRDPQTHELLLSGQGQLHIEVTVAKLKRRFGVEVLLKPPRIPYRETITAPTDAHGRHKKQTGGHGQFGDCRIRVEPLPRGSGFQFVDDVFGGAIPRSFIPAIEKGIQDARARGFLAGFPMVDFKVSVFDGSFHPVDSNELSFKLAGSAAFKDAMLRARPTLLEPIMRVEVYVPTEFAGDVMGDLNGRRGRIGGMDTRDALTIIRADVPMAEMLAYEQHLTSATGGRGSYHMEYSHYEEVPHSAQARIIASSRAVAGHEAAGEP